MIDVLRKLLFVMTKAEIAYHLGLSDTQSLSMWISRGSVPLKYHKSLKELLDAKQN